MAADKDVRREMLISHDVNETRVAIVENKELVELYVERARHSVVGNIYLGKVTDVLPGMQAAFVDIGLEKNAYLYVDDVRTRDGDGRAESIGGAVNVGQKIMVQVTRDAMGTKGARVSMALSIPGRFLVLTPCNPRRAVSKKIEGERRVHLLELMARELPEELGAIARTACADADEADIIGDLGFLTRVWRRVEKQSREVVAPDILYAEVDLAMRCVRDMFSAAFDSLTIEGKPVYDKVAAFIRRSAPALQKRVHIYKDKTTPLLETGNLKEQIGQSFKREAPLPSGGFLVIDKTEALITIDVNTGSYVGRRNLEETLLKTNLEAAHEAVRQLRLRDLGGIIIIDFIDMELDSSKERLMARLAAELERDHTRTKLVGLDSLGLVEITRKNTGDGLFETMTEICPWCAGTGRRMTGTTRKIAVEREIRSYVHASRARSFLFALNDETYAYCTGPGVNLAAVIKAETGKEVRFIADNTLDALEVACVLEGEKPSTPLLTPRLFSKK
ncbi:MAG: Rne/Rng family ribonuclease [Actinomycetes bacterium]|jgi:ribonuclease G|nr:Rne/Rng family ribonuclease [Actinomycetes bacterium]